MRPLVLGVAAGVLAGVAAGGGAGVWAGQHYAETGPRGERGVAGLMGPVGPAGPTGRLSVLDQVKLQDIQHSLAGGLLIEQQGFRCPFGTQAEGYFLNQTSLTGPPPPPLVIPVCRIK